MHSRKYLAAAVLSLPLAAGLPLSESIFFDAESTEFVTIPCSSSSYNGVDASHTVVVETFTVPLHPSTTATGLESPTGSHLTSVTATFTVPAANSTANSTTLLHTFTYTPNSDTPSSSSNTEGAMTTPATEKAPVSVVSISVDTGFNTNFPAPTGFPGPGSIIPGEPTEPATVVSTSNQAQETVRPDPNANAARDEPPVSFALTVPGQDHSAGFHAPSGSPFTFTSSPTTPYVVSQTCSPDLPCFTSPTTSVDTTCTTASSSVDTTCTTTTPYPLTPTETCEESSYSSPPGTPVTLTYELTTKVTVTATQPLVSSSSSESPSSSSSVAANSNAVTLTYTLPAGAGHSSTVVTLTTSRPTAAPTASVGTNSVGTNSVGTTSRPVLSTAGTAPNSFSSQTDVNATGGTIVSSSSSSATANATNSTASPTITSSSSQSGVIWSSGVVSLNSTALTTATIVVTLSAPSTTAMTSAASVNGTSSVQPSASGQTSTGVVILTKTSTFTNSNASTVSPSTAFSSDSPSPSANGTISIIQTATAHATVTLTASGSDVSESSTRSSGSTSQPSSTGSSRRGFIGGKRLRGKRRISVEAAPEPQPDSLVFDFDDFTAMDGPNHQVPKPQRIATPYHGFNFSEGFKQVSSTGPFIAASEPGMLQYTPLSGGRVAGRVSAASQAAKFNLVSWKMGCNSTASMCHFNFTGMRQDDANGEKTTGSEVVVVPSCKKTQGCSLSLVALEREVLTDLTAFTVDLAADGANPQAPWWADDLHFDYTCTGGATCQLEVPVPHERKVSKEEHEMSACFRLWHRIVSSPVLQLLAY